MVIVLCSVPLLRERVGCPQCISPSPCGHPTLGFHPAVSSLPSESTGHVTARDLGSLVMNQEPMLYLSTKLNLVSGTNYPVKNPIPHPPAAPRGMQAWPPAAFPTALWTHKTGCRGNTGTLTSVSERLAQQGALPAGTKPRPSPCSTRLEKEKWMHDLNTAIEAAKGGDGMTPALPGSTACAPPRSESWPRPPGASTTPKEPFL